MKESTKTALSVLLGLFFVLSIFSLLSLFVSLRSTGMPKEFLMMAARLLPVVSAVCLFLCGILLLLGVWTGSKALRFIGYVFFILQSLAFLAYNVYTLIAYSGAANTAQFVRAFAVNLLGILCGVLLIVSLKVRSKLLVFFIALILLGLTVINWLNVNFDFGTGTGFQLVGAIVGVILSLLVNLILYVSLVVDAGARAGAQKSLPAVEAEQ